MLFSNAFTWRYLNRTLYRPDSYWLRNDPRNFNASEAAVQLKDKYGIAISKADKFYKTHKISQEDFLLKLNNEGAKHSELLASLYDHGEGNGRHGVMNLKQV
jgi:hypothetical protein